MVRFGTVEDFTKVMHMLDLCKADMKIRGLNFWNETYPDNNIIMSDLMSGNSVVYDLDGKVVAFLVMYPKKPSMIEESYNDHSNYVYVSRVMVHPEYRRHGYAQEILKFVEEQGYSSIRLLTRNTNTFSVNLYTKLGYKVVKEETKENVIMQHCEKILK